MPDRHSVRCSRSRQEAASAAVSRAARRQSFEVAGPWHPSCIRAPLVATYDQRSGSTTLDALPTTELMRQILGETKELVRLETKLAREEMREDLVQLQSVAVFGGTALVLALLGLSAMVLALVLVLGGEAWVALVVAVALLVGASLGALLAWRRVPRPPMARTRARLESDVTQLKEHIQ